MRYKNPDLYLIKWQDSQVEIGWNEYDKETIENRQVIDSVGYLIAENDHTILLAADIGPVCVHDDYTEIVSNRTMAIPKGSIIERSVLVNPYEEVKDEDRLKKNTTNVQETTSGAPTVQFVTDLHGETGVIGVLIDTPSSMSEESLSLFAFENLKKCGIVANSKYEIQLTRINDAFDGNQILYKWNRRVVN